MGLFSPGGENILDFLELRQVLSTYDGDLRDPSGGLRKGLSPCEFMKNLILAENYLQPNKPTKWTMMNYLH